MSDHNTRGTLDINKDYLDQIRRRVNTIAYHAHKNSKDHGFWQGEQNYGEKICLMHAELSECLEAQREGNPPSSKIPEFSCEEEELADAIIRILDYAEARGFDLGGAIIAKMQFNRTREHKHGKKF